MWHGGARRRERAEPQCGECKACVPALLVCFSLFPVPCPLSPVSPAIHLDDGISVCPHYMRRTSETPPHRSIAAERKGSLQDSTRASLFGASPEVLRSSHAFDHHTAALALCDSRWVRPPSCRDMPINKCHCPRGEEAHCPNKASAESNDTVSTLHYSTWWYGDWIVVLQHRSQEYSGTTRVRRRSNGLLARRQAKAVHIQKDAAMQRCTKSSHAIRVMASASAAVQQYTKAAG